jgi:ATP synthase F1 delta subunit
LKHSTQTTPFSRRDIKQVQTTPDHKPPSQDDTIEGRYASVLFTSASQEEALFTIYENIVYLKGLYDNSEAFVLFIQNAGIGMKEIHLFNESLKSVGQFHPLTFKFLEILAENKRLNFIAGIAVKYLKLYKQFKKEEKITIISAEKLSSAEESEVLSGLKDNPQNEGKEFLLEFTVDPSIKGGLQMYTETQFMDMSLTSRMDCVRSEVTKLIN